MLADLLRSGRQFRQVGSIGVGIRFKEIEGDVDESLACRPANKIGLSLQIYDIQIRFLGDAMTGCRKFRRFAQPKRKRRCPLGGAATEVTRDHGGFRRCSGKERRPGLAPELGDANGRQTQIFRPEDHDLSFQPKTFPKLGSMLHQRATRKL